MAIYKIRGENREVFNEEHFSRELRSSKFYSEERKQELLPRMENTFRCCDDDGITYFWGVCSSNQSFAPLDEVGRSYGCTYIEYKNPLTGHYEPL